MAPTEGVQVSMSKIEDVLNSPAVVQPPKDYRPGLEFDGKNGEATSKPVPSDAEFDHRETMIEAGLDPDLFEVSNFRFSTWDAQTKEGQERFKSWKFTFRMKSDEYRVDVDDLIQVIRDSSVPREAKPVQRPEVTVFAVGDLQLGKGDGDGSEGIITRYMSAMRAAVRRYNDNPTGQVLIAFLGDCVEGVVSQGGRNIGNNDLTLTDQLKVLRHLMTQTVLEFQKTGAELTVASVPGNHDETYRSPVNSQPHDSFAVDSLRAVEEAFSLAGRDVHSFLYPKDSELAIHAEVGGIGFLLAHGHQWRTGKHYQWWQGQSFSRQTGHDAVWLLAGHRHHLFIDTESDRYFLQVPALEQRSDWWRNKTGQVGNPGAVFLEVEPDGAPRVIALVQ